MKFVDIADEIYRELSEPTDTPVPTIAFWLRAHYGDLNLLLAGTNFSLDIDGEITPELKELEKTIFKNSYILHYYDVQIRNNLGASGYDWSELAEGDSSVRRVSKNEIAKTFRLLRNDLRDEIKAEIQRYRLNKALPISLEPVSNLHEFQRFDAQTISGVNFPR